MPLFSPVKNSIAAYSSSSIAISTARFARSNNFSLSALSEKLC
jgi:hypothetical protein